MRKIATILSILVAFGIVMSSAFGVLPTIALSTHIVDLEIKIAANEAFMLDEAIDTLQERIWTNIDRQQTYIDRAAPIPTNLREHLRGLESEMEKLKARRKLIQ